jgi:hypothetical protein
MSIPDFCQRSFDVRTRCQLLTLETFLHPAKESEVAWAEIWRICRVLHSIEIFCFELCHDLSSVMAHGIGLVHPENARAFAAGMRPVFFV